jgi:eukaryotic-like serine/threonine-protein kinase
VHGVGPSTVLGGRYAMQRRLEQLPRAERWSAHDTTLERDVVVVCFAEQEPHAAATLDAARRAAGLDNHRLVRVLDVGRSDGVAFFVEEAIPDAHTLTHLLEQGGLPAEEVRRIAGETASGLEAARMRGLHHLRLGPDSVLRAHDGTVKVRGVATAAAMASEDDADATRASRIDAVGVVAVTYAALTSRWPLPGSVRGLESAPHVVGGVPAPSEIAAGVPGDLDALCRLTLNDDEGPLTPGDFASQIAPWTSAQVTGLGSSPGLDDGVGTTIALPVNDLPRPTPAVQTGTAKTGSPTSSGAEEGATAAAAASAAAAAGAVGSALGTAGQTAGHVAGAAAQRVGTFARAAADKAAERKAQRQAAQEREEQRRISLAEALIDGHETIDPPLPMLSKDTAEAPSRDQSKLVLAVMAGFLVVVMLLGFYGVSHIGSKTDLGLGRPPTPRTTVSVTAPPVTVTPTPSTSTGTGESQTFAILSATGFDPEGDNAERNSEAPRVFDGNDKTFWSSEGYASPDLGGLKKGVGIRLDLGQNHQVSKVSLVLPDASDVTAYVGEDRTLEGAAEIGTSKGKSGTITLTADKPVKGQYVFVWFTKVSQVSDGRFRATLAEVTVS